MLSHGGGRACYYGQRPASGICEECRLAQSIRYRTWRTSHLAHNAQRMREYRAQRERTDAERATQNRLNRERLVRLKNAPTDHHTRAEVFERDGGICQICEKTLDPKNWHEDHIIPLIAGGSDLLDNVQATCPPCNWSKGVTIPQASVY